MQKTILFDLDGTVIDSTKAILSSFKYAFSQHKNEKNFSEDKILPLIGISLDETFKILNISDINSYMIAYKEHYKNVYIETRLLSRAKEALELAHSFAKTGVVTNKGSVFTKNLLQELGILKYLEVIITRNDVLLPKPHEEGIQKALKLLNSSKDNAFLIGDTSTDFKAASKARIKALIIKPMYDNEKELLKLTDTIYKDVYEAVLHIKNLKE